MQIFGLGVTICVILADRLYGWNIHIWDLTPSQALNGRKVSLAAQTLFLFSSGLAKISILLTYLRIASRDSWFRRVTVAVIILVAIQVVAFLAVLWLQCRPMRYYWTSDTLKHCISEGPVVLSQAIVMVLLDLMVCALPIPTLLKLQLPKAERILLVALFSLGIVVVVAAGMRAYWTHHVTDETYDVTWEGFYLWIWTAVEANLGVICGNIPALRALYKRMFPSKSRSYYTTESTRARAVSNARQSKSGWTDSLHGNKGIKINDDHIHVENDRIVRIEAIRSDDEDEIYEMRKYKSHESHPSSLEMGTYNSKEQRLPDHSRGPLSHQ
jgi:hypothetical protein